MAVAITVISDKVNPVFSSQIGIVLKKAYYLIFSHSWEFSDGF